MRKNLGCVFFPRDRLELQNADWPIYLSLKKTSALPLGLSIYLSKKRAPHFFLLPPHTFVGFLKDEKWCVGPGFTPVSGKNSWGNGPQMASSGIFLAFPSAYLSISAENERLAPQPIYLSLEISSAFERFYAPALLWLGVGCACP